jgi:hypothetical protein
MFDDEYSVLKKEENDLQEELDEIGKELNEKYPKSKAVKVSFYKGLNHNYYKPKTDGQTSLEDRRKKIIQELKVIRKRIELNDKGNRHQ